MERISADQFKETYGEEAYNAFPSPYGRVPELQATGYSLSETAGDIGETVGGVIESLRSRVGKAQESVQTTSFSPSDWMSGRGQTPVESLAQTVSQAALLFGDTLFELGKGAVKVALPEADEKLVGDKATSAMQELAQMPGVSDTISWYQKQSPRTQRNLAIPVALLEVAGLKGTSALRPAGVVKTKSDDIFKRFGTRMGETEGVTGKISAAVDMIPGVRKFRYELSDIPENARNAIKRTSEENITKHADIAKKAMEETTNKTNIEYVGELAEEAYKKIDANVKTANDAKKSALASVGKEKLSSNPAGTTIDEVQKIAESRFGVRVANDGSVTELPGRVAKLDAPSTKLLSDYVTKLRTLGPNPTVQQVDDFVDWAQSQLYKQSISYSQLEAADKAVVAALKETTGSINSKLKADAVVKGTEYATANADMSRLLPMLDELSRGLGAEGRKGGAFVKRVFSTSDARTKELFQEIYDETGVNLADEATLAKFFMDAAGDTRQNSLLKEIIDIGESATDFDLTRPLSWGRFLREKADMDGEELAREILRRAKEQEAAGQIPKGTTEAMEKVAKDEGVAIATPEAEVGKLVKDIEARLSESSRNSVPDYLKNNKQAGFVAGSDAKQTALKQGVKDIETKLREFDSRGVSETSAAYKQLLKARDDLYKQLGKA